MNNIWEVTIKEKENVRIHSSYTLNFIWHFIIVCNSFQRLFKRIRFGKNESFIAYSSFFRPCSGWLYIVQCLTHNYFYLIHLIKWIYHVKFLSRLHLIPPYQWGKNEPNHVMTDGALSHKQSLSEEYEFMVNLASKCPSPKRCTKYLFLTSVLMKSTK